MNLTLYVLDILSCIIRIDVFPGVPDVLVWIPLILIAVWLANHAIDF
jgi:hypothetical protein